MKQLLSLLLVMCMLLPYTTLAELSEDNRAILLERTEALTALMAEAAGSETYLRLYLGRGNDDVADTVRRIAASGWDQPVEGTVFVLRDGAIEAYLSALQLSMGEFPEDLRERVRQSVTNSMPQAVVNQAGPELMAATSVLRTGEAFLADDSFPEGALVYLRYNPDYAVLCAYVKNAENIVTASLVPAPADCLKAMRRIMTGAMAALNLYEEYPLTFLQK